MTGVLVCRLLPILMVLLPSRSTADMGMGSPPAMGMGASALPTTCDEDPLTVTATFSDGDAGFDAAREQWASNMGSEEQMDQHIHPTLIVFCSTDQEVLDTIAYAKMCDYAVAVRSGGHQYSGYSSCNADKRCIQLDVSALRDSTAPDAGNGFQVTLGVGLRLEDMFAILVPLYRFVPTGVCTTVGVGGHFQSSALGFLARGFGLGMDYVVQFRIALASGVIETVTKASNPELYWAVLGGGPGSWGVVLEYTLDTEYGGPGGAYMASNSYRYIFIYNPTTFKAMAAHAMTLAQTSKYDRDLALYFTVSPIEAALAAGNTQHFIIIAGLWAGLDNGPFTQAHFDEIIQPFLDAPGAIAIDGTSPLAQPWIPIPLAWQALTSDWAVYRDWRYHEHTMQATDYSIHMGPEFWDAIAKEADRRLLLPDVVFSFQLWLWGGQLAENGVGGASDKGNSYPVRNMKAMIDDWYFFKNNDQAETVRNDVLQLRSDLSDHFLDHHKHGGHDPELTWMSTATYEFDDSILRDDWNKYYPSRTWYRRLQRVKSDVDKDNLFSTDMTVPPRKGKGKGKSGN